MFRAPPAPPPRQLYLVEADLGLFKVGSSRFPVRRVEAIASHAPCRVRLVAVWPGEMLDEQRIHDQLEPFRSHHEWFRKEGSAAVYFAAQFGKGVETVKDWSECDRPTMFRRRKVLSEAAKKKWSDPAYKAERAACTRGAVARRVAAERASLAEAS